MIKNEIMELLSKKEEHGSDAREDRPLLLECIEFLKKDDCRLLLVSKISCLGKTMKEVVDKIDELTKSKVNIYSEASHCLKPMCFPSRSLRTDAA